MKLQKEELAAVASHIYDRIKEKNKINTTKEEKKLIENFLKERKDTNKQIKALQDKGAQLQKKVFEKLKISYNFYYTNNESIEREVIRLKTKQMPSLDEIRKAIIMKSLFSNETELKKFIEELIAKY